MTREVELKLEVEPERVGELRGHPLLAGRERARQRQLSAYFDTRKNRLRTAGYALRVRESEGRFIQTIKGEAGAAGLFDRDEWEVPVAELRPEASAAAGTPVAGLVAARDFAKLVPIVKSEVERTTWLLDHQSSRLEVTLDEGRISAAGAEQPLHEIEIELKEGRAEALFAFARLLARRVPLRIAVLAKSERGFALADGSLGKVAKAAPVAVDEAMSVAQGFTAIAHACLRQFRLNEPLVTRERDARAMHQARVAMRRLRAALSLFRPALRDGGYERLREELRWFTAQLGEARNLDVFLDRLEADHQDRPRLAADREQAYDQVVATLGSQRFLDLMLGFLAWVELGDWRKRGKAARPLPPFAARRIDRLWEKVAAAGARLAELPEEPRHRLRIDIKKLRYALEFVDTLYRSAGPRQKRFMTALEGLQEELGQLNDLATARSIIARLGRTDGDAGETLASAPSEEENDLLARAAAHFRRLLKAGPFWRGLPPARAGAH